MKYLNFKLLIFFAALALAIPPAWAKTVTTTILATTEDGSQLTWDNNLLTFSLTQKPSSPKYSVETSSYARGLGTNSKTGTHVLTSDQSFEGVTKVEIDASTNGSGNSISVSVGSDVIGSEHINNGTNYANDTYTYQSSSPHSGQIVITIDDQVKSVWIKTIRVTYEENTTPSTDPWINVSTSSLTINDVVGANNDFVVSAGNIRDFQNLSVASDNDKFSVIGVPAEGSGNSWASWGGFNSNSNHTVDGTVTVTYGGTELIANGNVVCGTLDAESKSVAVSYRSDVYVVGKYGNEAWNFGDGSNPMTYNSTDKTYTGTITVPAESYILFARKTGETYDWNESPTYNGGNRLFFGAKTDSDGASWWYGDKTGDDLVTNPSDVGQTKYSPIYFKNAGTYTITIDAEAKTFSITSTNVANIAQAQAFTGKFTFTGNAVVTYQNGEYMWIRDVANRDGEVNSGLIKGSLDGTFTNGDVLKSGWKATKNVENTGVIDFINPEGVTLDVNNGPVAPYALTELTNADINKYVSMSGLTVTRVNNWQYTVTADGTNTFYIYDQFHVTDGHKLEVDKTYNVVGVVSRYNGNPQLYLISAEEVKELKVTLTSDTKTAEINETIPVTVTVENAEGDYAVTYKFGENGTPTTLTGNTINVTSATAGQVELIVNVTNGDNHATATETYTFTEPIIGGNVFVKVTSADQLVAGKKYIFVYGNYAMGTEATGSFLTPIEITGGDEVEVGDDVAIMTLGGTSGQYTLALGDKYLHAVNSTSLDFGEETKWSIAAGSNGANDSGFRAKHADYGRAVKKHNSMARFGNYSTGDNNSSYAWIYVEKATAPQPEPLAVTLPEAPAEPYKVGQVVKVQATVENGSENTVLTYKVGDETLTIDNDGNVTLPNKKAGEVVLTVTAVDGDKQDTDSKTYVFDAADALAITLTPASGSFYVGDEKNVTVAVEGAIVENPTITYKFGEEGETQNYSETGIVLPTAQAGTINLTVMVDDGGYEHTGETTATGTYTVNYKALTITLDPESGHQFTVGAENTKVKVEFTNNVGDVEAEYVASYTVNDEVKTITLTADEQGYVTLPNDKAVTYTLTVTALDERPDGDIVEATGTYTFTAAPAITFGMDVVHEPEGDTYHVGDVVKVKVANVENNIGNVTVTYKIGDTELTPEEGYVTIPTDEVANVTLTVTVTDGYDHATEATKNFVFDIAAAPAITFDLVATPAQDNYTVGDVVNVKVENIQNAIGDNKQITYTTNFSREEQTYDDTKGIDITSNEAGTVTLEVTITDGYQHAAAGVKSANYVFAKAGAISIAFDPVTGTEFNVGAENANVTVTITGAAEGYQATYTIGDETGNVPADGIIPLPNDAAGNVTLEVTVGDGLEHEGENSASAVYHFVKQNATVAFDVETANAVIGTAFDAPVATTTPAGLDVTYESSDETVATVNASTGVVNIVGEGTTTITATVVGNNLYNGGATASYTLTVAPQPVVATPVITPNGGSYSAAQTVNITCATEGATILYSTNGTNWTEGSSLTVSENCTVYAKATKVGSIDSQVAQATFKFEIPETPEGPMLKGYYQIKNNANGEYVNVLGRKTLRFTTNPADQAGSVIYVETSDKGDGQVQSLRSQAADLQGYADRAMRYVPEVVQLVVNKLHAAGSGEVLGEHGYDEIMAAFNESFDYHLYVEHGDKGYRLYGKTPSMQPVVDFYRSHKDQVDAKLPMIEGFINEAIDKILEKTNGSGASILVDYDIHEVWQRMGAENSGLTEPKDATSDLAFYQEVLNDKDNVWNFAYQSVMIYWERLKNNETFQQMKPQLGEFANYIDKLEQIRPNAKYYVIQTDGKPDYVSDGNALILNDDDCTYWTLEPRTEFTVNFPADTKYGDQYVTTLYTDFAYNVPEGVTAYKVTAVDEQGLAQIEALTSPIAAQTPVLLMAQASGRAEVAKTLTIAESGNAVDGNLLVGPDFLIERDSILTPQVAAVFALAKTYLSEDFYNNYVKQYEHLMFRNSGTVNNKYFWGISLDDLKNYCSYENNEGMKDCDVRSLGIADGKIAFSEHFTVATNKAFLINKDFDVINLAVVETPVITPVPQNPYTAPVEVTITCATEGATILYTTDGGENWTEYTEPFTLNETTTVQAYATKAGLGDSEKTEEVQYVIELPVATPVVTPEGGSYGSAQTVTITCDTPDAVISYSTDGGKTWTEYTEPFTVDTDCTITVKAEKTGMTPSETSVSYVFEIQPAPITMDALKGYFYIKNNGTENYANVVGRKTLRFTDAPEDQAGTVFYVETDEHGQVQSLRSQAADLQGYADRAMGYVPKLVQIVVNKLNATGSGNILGEHGYDEIMAAFNASFDHHLYVEPTNKGENVYRLYAKTPSMQPVVDFYRSHKDQVDAKLPMLEGFINTAIHKILEKTDNVGAGILEDYDIHKVWENMGGANSGLTEPVDDATDLTFYQEVLNNKDNVWNFAYQSVMIYWNNLMNNETFQQQILPQLGNDAQYLENLTQIRPNTKYYVIENGNEPDYVSENHVYITGEQPKTYWTLEPRTTFDVNIPENLVYGNQYVTTLYTDFAYTLPEGVTAYKVTGITVKGLAETEALEGPIAAQTPVLLMANEAGVKTLTIAESGNAVEGNLLVGPDFLIERDSILTPQIAALFSMAKYFLNEEFYNNNVKQYEHLMFRTAGTVNNKYFWGLSFDDLKENCSFVNEDGEKETDIRSLGIEKGAAAFCEHWTVEMNKAFLIDEEHDAVTLRVKDITRDGVWDIDDAVALIQILLEAPAVLHADIYDYDATDFNHNDITDIVDATDLIQYILFK